MKRFRERGKIGGTGVDLGNSSFASHWLSVLGILLILLSCLALPARTEAQSTDWRIMTAGSKEYTASDVPKDIPGMGTETSILTIADTGPITDLNVKLNITHPYNGDLDVFLIAPDGTRVELFTDVGGTSADFQDTILDDEASQSITDGSGPFTGSYRPEGSLADFIGKNITGTWTLEITDDWSSSRAGTLNSWSLIVELEVERPPGMKYGGGTGEPNDPYQIATAADLITLGETPGDYGKCFLLTADIDLAPKLPGRKVFDKAVIAPDTDNNQQSYQGAAFTGVFDANSYIIRNLTINGKGYLGLFGQLAGEARNLRVVDVNVVGSDSYVSGLAGENSGSITASYSTGAIKGHIGVGGLVGSNTGDVTQCYSSSATASTAGWWVGGLVGANTGNITTSGSTGRVSATNSVGGLVGFGNSGTVSQCYSTCSVSGTSLGVGGLVGYNGGTAVIHCYSTGIVSGGSPGGLMGINHADVTGCFWDTQTSGRTWSAGGTGKTTAQMQTVSTFLNAGWDFVHERANGTVDIWRIDEGKDYPRLWWESTSPPPPPPPPPAEGKVIELTEATFDQIVLGSDIPVLVDFGAPWCPPCWMMDPVIEEIAKEYAGKVKVCKLDTDYSPNINRRYNIQYIPTFILFNEGQIEKRWVGVTPKKDLTDAIDELLTAIARRIIISVVRANGASGNQAPVGPYNGNTQVLPTEAGGIKNGNLCFSDRTYTWTTTPGELAGLEYVRTFYSDKTNTTVTYTLTTKREATVIITIDGLITNPQAAADQATARFAPAGTFVDSYMRLDIFNSNVTTNRTVMQRVFTARLPAGTYVFSAMPSNYHFYVIAAMN